MTINPTSARAGRTLALARLGWAAALLWAPRRLIHLGGDEPDRRAVDVARVLGVRHALQAVVELATWPRLRTAGTVVDALHASTAAALAVTDSRWRSVAACDTVAAGAFAVAGRRV